MIISTTDLMELINLGKTGKGTYHSLLKGSKGSQRALKGLKGAIKESNKIESGELSTDQEGNN